jgi:hypothetical protein
MPTFRAISAAIAAASALPLLLLAGPASASTAASSHDHHLSRCTARGQYAICDTSGTTRDYPTSIHVHVSSSRPGERVFVAWDVTCAKGNGAGSRSGSETASTVVNKKIRMPYARPDYCIVSADAQLQAGGSWIEVSITYWT